MPLLGADDPLPSRPHRVLVAGTSGAGKTTLARRLAQVLDLPHVEIDALYHGPHWMPRDSFESDVERFTAEPEWVTEWQYSPVRALLAARADLLIWLDLPRQTVMRRITVRTLQRRLRREVLWNGNIEPPLRTFFTDREHVVRWAWSTHDLTQSRVLETMQSHPDLLVVRLRSSVESKRWLNEVLQGRTKNS